MSEKLLNRLQEILDSIIGPDGLSAEEENDIIRRASAKLSDVRNSEEDLIDALIGAFAEEQNDYLEAREKGNIINDPYNHHTMMNSIYSSDDDESYRYAEMLDELEEEIISEIDLYRGTSGSYYDEKGKTYRPTDEEDEEYIMDEFEIRDGPHDNLEYHNEATNSKGVHRSRADMLSR